MKIIKQGKIKKKDLRGTCRHCGCIIECAAEEANYIYDPRGESCYLKKCPTCKQDIVLYP